MSDTFAVTQLPQDGAELKLQYERILQVLDLVIKKIKICVCLPNFLEHSPTILGNVAECEYIRGTSAKYLRQHSSSLANFKSGDGTMINNTNPKAAPKRKTPLALDSLKIDPDMTHIVEMLYKNRKVKNVAFEKYAHLSKAKYVHITDALKMMHQIMKEKSEINAIEQIMREKSLKRAFRENIEMRTHLQAKPVEPDENLFDKVNLLNRVFLKYSLKGCDQLESFDANQPPILVPREDSETRMLTVSAISLLRQSDLSNEAKTVTSQYDAVLSEHLKIEKKLRAKRLKFETKLVSWLNKFDADTYNEQEERMDVLRNSFKEQRAQFEQLWNEKLEESLALFRINRAARIIQRFWRKYRPPQQKKQKKKTKKKKKFKGPIGKAARKLARSDR
ncbi:hypothetical protein RI129_010383 [Pyrocoelia pectoralis]|uniref:Dynein regulatory complex protein 10 n=1 Tax=Pyrocoelia pectoralis TaxID=417401 RepID=A0AAN7VB67_9COLE